MSSGPELVTVYSSDMVADAESSVSPSAAKPSAVAEALGRTGWPIRIIPPEPMAVSAIERVHDPTFVREVLELVRPNGFGSRSASVSRSLRYTCGAFHTGAVEALARGISASLTSGFHHAHHASARGFCTFNGLMISAMRLLDEKRAERIAIIDCDYHYGDGTQSLIYRFGLSESVLHLSFGKLFHRSNQAGSYLESLASVRSDLITFRPDIIFFQAGADAHVDDPLGGLLSTDQMKERDRLMFMMARELGIPLTWNLAGGYQREHDGSIPRVVELHLNTFGAALGVWGML